MISPIAGLSPIASLEGDQDTSVQEAGGSSMFGQVFQSAVQNVKDTDAEKNQAEYLLATGQLDNPAALTIASTKNQVAVDLLVQLRNRAMDAYSQLTSISF
ncbi:MAG: flagellar hook-basal body complex protein FliE [Acutalibacter sp.]|jgi:flagellar hook-basal body complex protein FliE